MMNEENSPQVFSCTIIHLPLHLEVPEALALTVAQADRRPAYAAPEEALGEA